MVSKGDEAELVAAAAAGLPLAKIAATAGVSISTVQRRLREPEIVRAVQEAQTDSRRRALGRVLELREAALARVGELLLAEEPTVVLRAAGLILTSSFKVETRSTSIFGWQRSNRVPIKRMPGDYLIARIPRGRRTSEPKQLAV